MLLVRRDLASLGGCTHQLSCFSRQTPRVVGGRGACAWETLMARTREACVQGTGMGHGREGCAGGLVVSLPGVTSVGAPQTLFDSGGAAQEGEEAGVVVDGWSHLDMEALRWLRMSRWLGRRLQYSATW
jgi:hypothetical protein